MGKSGLRRARLGGAVRALVGFAVAYGVPIFLVPRVWQWCNSLHEWWWRGHVDFSFWHLIVDRLGHASGDAVAVAYVFGLAAATVLVPLAFVARTLARARVRAGLADPFERVRRWTNAHPSATRALTAALPVAIAAKIAWGYDKVENHAPPWDHIAMAAVWALPAVVAALVLTGLARAGLRALLTPTVDAAAPARTDVASDEIAFDAVAVTRETRAAVGAMAAVTLAMVAWVATLPTNALYHDGHVIAAALAYMAAALGGAALFRRASRIAVGLDGVLVRGTSRTRFFAYKDLDGAEASGSDLILRRGDRVVLRLQLHGEDAARRGAVLERIRVAIAGASASAHDAKLGYVAAASSRDLTRAAQGAGDYRATALSRDELWDLVEGPAIASGARRSAAFALARSGGDEDRARLRVAAEHCAEPQVRIALQRLADAEELDEPAAAAPPVHRAFLQR